MKFILPISGEIFEISDEWWIESKAHEYKRVISGYRALSNPEFPTQYVHINNLCEPRRNLGVPMFDKSRTYSIINAILNNTEIPPIEVHQRPEDRALAIRDGFHRYHISIAFGFEEIPISVRPYFDINEI